MSYDEQDAAMDELYERIGDELYPSWHWSSLSSIND